MRVKFQYNGMQELEISPGVIRNAYDIYPTPEQTIKEELLKDASLSLENFSKIIEENNITEEDIKNSSINQESSICYFLIKNEMYDHLKLLIDKFGKEILNFGSIYNPSYNFGEVFIPLEYHSLWDATLIHANKNSFFSDVKKLIDLNVNPNLSSFELLPDMKKYTFLDKIICKIDINEGENCDNLLKVGKYLLKNGAKSATKENKEIQEIFKRLKN